MAPSSSAAATGATEAGDVAKETDSLLPMTNGNGTTNHTQNSNSGKDSKSCRSFLVSFVHVLAGILIGALCCYIAMISLKSAKTATSGSNDTTTMNAATDGASTNTNESKSNNNNNQKAFHTASNSRYTATQFISFSINTLGGVDEFGECVGREVDKEDGLCYLGNTENIQDDLDHRFEIIEQVLLTLKDDELEPFPEIDHSPHVLKIFMLPEFYLRGPYGAYSVDEMMKPDSYLEQTADRVRELVADPAYEDYLFVMGTVIIADPNKSWNVTSQHIDKDEILYYNLAPIFRGGPGHYPYLVPKNYISTADFLNRANGLPDPRQSHISEYTDLSESEDLYHFLYADRNLTIIENGILDVDGVRIGIEICLDHRLGVLYKYLQRQQQEDSTAGKAGSRPVKTNSRGIIVPEEDLMDVHLITSAGMAIERGPTPVRQGGVVYLTDGGASSAACVRGRSDTDFDASAVCRDRHNDGPTGLKHVPLGEEGYSSYVELATCLNPDDAPWKPLIKGYYSEYAEQGCAYTLKLHGIDVFDEYRQYPPSIEIYPTIRLP